MVIDEDWKLIGFQEKPKSNPATIPGRPDMVLASMGNYIFNKDVLVKELTHDAEKPSAHDFGKDIITHMYPNDNVFVYDFTQNKVPGTTDAEKRLLERCWVY